MPLHRLCKVCELANLFSAFRRNPIQLVLAYSITGVQHHWSLESLICQAAVHLPKNGKTAHYTLYTIWWMTVSLPLLPRPTSDDDWTSIVQRRYTYVRVSRTGTSLGDHSLTVAEPPLWNNLTSPSTSLWTCFPRVPLVTDDTPVLLRTAATVTSCFLSALHICIYITFHITLYANISRSLCRICINYFSSRAIAEVAWFVTLTQCYCCLFKSCNAFLQKTALKAVVIRKSVANILQGA